MACLSSYIFLFASLVHASVSLHDHRHPDTARLVLLKSGHIDTRVEKPVADLHADSHSHILIHIDPLKDAREKVERLVGQTLEKYLPHHTWMVFAPSKSIAALAGIEGVLWVSQMQNEWKLSEPWEVLVTQAKLNSTHYAFQVSVSRDEAQRVDWDVVNNQYADKFFFRVLPSKPGRVQLFVLGQSSLDVDLTVVLNMHVVSYIEPLPRFNSLNKWTRGVLQAGVSLPDYASRTGLPGWSHGLNGEGEIIGIGDTGLDRSSCFFSPIPDSSFVSWNSRGPGSSVGDLGARKVVQYVKYQDSSDSVGHGTHVSGTAAGSWASSASVQSEHNGIAPAAKIAFFDLGSATADQGSLSTPEDLGEDYFEWAYKIGARVHSNSWGGVATRYSFTDQDVDEYHWNRKDFLAVFAAGNDGNRGSSTIVSPASSKNALAVGASINSPDSFNQLFCSGGIEPDPSICSLTSNSANFGIDDIAMFSSMGPAPDGRMKPDVVAPGFYTYSAEGSISSTQSCSDSLADSLSYSLGTSMSTPAIAGLVSLARQYFREGFYPGGYRNRSQGFTPSGALLKAVTINGAVRLNGKMDIGTSSRSWTGKYRNVGPAPNNIQGFGRPQLNNMVRIQNYSNFNVRIAGASRASYADPILKTTGDFVTFRICVLGSGSPAPRVTLVWMDYPGQPQASIALVNDLDLTVTQVVSEGSGQVLYGNGKQDRLNNVEQVELANAQAGQTYDITVAAANIAIGPQPFSLVISGKISSADSDGVCDFTGGWDDEDLLIVDKGSGDGSSGFQLWYIYIAVAAVAVLVAGVCAAKYIFRQGNDSDVVPPGAVGRADGRRGSSQILMPEGWRMYRNREGRQVYVHESGIITDTNPFA